MICCSDVMKPIEASSCCTPQDTAAHAARAIRASGCGCVPVVEDPDNLKLVGVVTEPVTVREEARRRAREELSKPEYLEASPGLVERAIAWTLERITALLRTSDGLLGGGDWTPAVALLLLVAAFVLVVRRRTGRVARGLPTEETLFLGRARTAAEHREAADAHAEAGRWDEAVRERLRAVVRAMEERGLLDARPGRTALEAAADGGEVLPGCADALRGGAELFDAVWYGGRHADAADHAALVVLDRQVAAARPAPLASAGVAARVTAPPQ